MNREPTPIQKRLARRSDLRKPCGMTSTLTKAGQTTVPADIRRKADWDAGATLDWCWDGGKVVVRRMEPKKSEPRLLTMESLRLLSGVPACPRDKTPLGKVRE